MAIQVTCPGCHARFKVSDKFAGKKGPCPKCKGEIQIPEASDEVKIHAPEQFGPKGVTGRAVLKPIFRQETEFSLKIAGIIAGVVLLIVIVAAVLGSTLAGKDDEAAYKAEHTQRLVIMTLGAIAIAPPIVFAGYTFLRDQELEPYRGKSLWTRVAFCSGLFAALWALIAIIHWQVIGWGEGFAIPWVIGIVTVMILLGAGASFVCLDLEFASGLFHYGLYFATCIILRLIAIGDAFTLE